MEFEVLEIKVPKELLITQLDVFGFWGKKKLDLWTEPQCVARNEREAGAIAEAIAAAIK